jgi:hypothetical protein
MAWRLNCTSELRLSRLLAFDGTSWGRPCLWQGGQWGALYQEYTAQAAVLW